MPVPPVPPRLRVVSCGDELLCGQTVDTNAHWLAGEAARLGWRLAGVRTIGDVEADIVQAVDDACRHADAVVLTGGLGPTEDDRTRFALARALGTGLTERPELVDAIRARFAAFGRPMGDSNRVQALIPDGADALENPNGTAPGFAARLHGARLFAFPGVPREMKAMFARHARDWMAGHPGRRAACLRLLRLHGLGESSIGEAIGEFMRPGLNPTVGTAVSDSLVAVRLLAHDRDEGSAGARVAAVEAKIRARLGPHIYGADDETLAGVVVRELLAQGRTVATAESCTGGWLAGAIVDIPGSSAVFHEGVVAYANRAKTARLGVPEEQLARHGAVSEATARAMAAGMRERSRADYALSVTGIAGPAGGTPEKPVGLAWVGLADRDGARAIRVQSLSDRGGNRRRAVNAALDWLRRTLAGLPPPWTR